MYYSDISVSLNIHKMAPILYKIAASPPANAARMLADIIGLELELKDIDFGALEHKSPEYLKMNPIGALPLLKDDDFLVSDSHAIMIYLLTKYGGDKAESLYPSDLRTRTTVNQVMFFDTGVFFIRVKEVALPAIFGDVKGITEKNIEGIEASYSVLEAYLQDRKFIAADQMTIADLSILATTDAFQGIHKLDPTKYPNIFVI